MLRTTGSRFLFPSRLRARPHISTRQYARLVHRWVESIGLESIAYGTHSMRRTKAAQIYRKTGNLRAVQLLLGHTKLESTVRYLGIDVDDERWSGRTARPVPDPKDVVFAEPAGSRSFRCGRRERLAVR